MCGRVSIDQSSRKKKNTQLNMIINKNSIFFPFFIFLRIFSQTGDDCQVDADSPVEIK